MPNCYLITIAAGSSLDQQSNNVTLFNLVEQVNIPPGLSPKPDSRVPVEVHAYVRLSTYEIGEEFEMRFALVSPTGLETYTDPAKHRGKTARLRVRTLGLPLPAILGAHELHVDFRTHEGDEWLRDRCSWPISFVQAEAKPKVTH